MITIIIIIKMSHALLSFIFQMWKLRQIGIIDLSQASKWRFK
jgi:hypothetical protein